MEIQGDPLDFSCFADACRLQQWPGPRLDLMAPPLQSAPQAATSAQMAGTLMKPIQKNQSSASRDAARVPRLYVANGMFPGDVLVFGGGPVRPDPKPKQNVYGSNTGLDDDEDIAVDAVGDMFVTNSEGRTRRLRNRDHLCRRSHG